MSRKNVVIVGGGGRLGSWFVRYFNDCGWSVSVVEANDQRSPAHIVPEFDVVLLAVPHPVSPVVIESYGRFLTEDHLLVDLSSVKSATAQATRNLKSEVLLVHPMWSPQVPTMNGQTMVICRDGRHDLLSRILLDEFENSGVILTMLSAEEHDRVMALVQVATHAMLLGLGELHRLSGFTAETLTACESPIYRMISAMLGRMLSHQAELYADIALCNPYGPDAVIGLAKCLTDFGEILKDENRKGFLDLFEGIQDYRGQEIPIAVADSATMIEALAKKRGTL
jgi:chorismate mutase/prephenate dehydrogenase